MVTCAWVSRSDGVMTSSLPYPVWTGVIGCMTSTGGFPLGAGERYTAFALIFKTVSVVMTTQIEPE